MTRITTVLFDLDGTTLYTLPDLKSALNYGLRCSGYPERSLDEVRRFIGNGLGKLVERALPAGLGEAEKQRVLADLNTYYAAHLADESRPYDGIPELLAALKADGYRIGIVSNKVDYAVQDLTRIFFPDTVEYATGEREGMPRKPQPDLVRLALEALGASPEQTLFVGDTGVDVETAKNAGLAGIFVSYGFRGRAALEEAGAGCIVDTPQQLLDAIRAL